MTYEQRKKLIADQLGTIAQSVYDLEATPSHYAVNLTINQLYQVMRQLSDWSEEQGY